jgi:diketogulonate reductase-like aldo/keto reductase
MRLPGARERDRVLKTALEVGITHFDVARMYGFGATEGVVGESFRDVRDQVTLATKFGIPSSAPGPFKVKLQSAARWILKLNPLLKERVKRTVATATANVTSNAHHRDYSVEEMKRSLQTSLAQLRTDHVDIFFLHEPAAADDVPADLVEALEARRNEGVIGAFGLAAFTRDLSALIQARPGLAGQALQHDYSILKSVAPALAPGVNDIFTGFFGVIRNAHAPLIAYLENDKLFARRWSDQLNIDLHQPENVGIVILALALVANPQGLVLFSSTRPQRLRAIVRGLRTSSLEKEQLLQFRDEVVAKINISHAR